MPEHAFQKCINPDCGATYDVGQVLVSCPQCNSLLDVTYDWAKLPRPTWEIFEHRWLTKGEHGKGALDFSGVWRFRELMPFYRTDADIVTIGEGRTNLQDAQRPSNSRRLRGTGRRDQS